MNFVVNGETYEGDARVAATAEAADQVSAVEETEYPPTKSIVIRRCARHRVNNAYIQLLGGTGRW